MSFKIFIINLRGRSDRLASARSQMEFLKLEFEVVRAVDGRNREPSSFDDYDEKSAMRAFGRRLMGEEVACFLSHVVALRRFLDSESEYALVLEDDFQWQELEAVELSLLCDRLAAIDTDWHVANIGYAVTRGYTFDDRTQTGMYIGHAHHLPTTATAILWSRRGAHQFLSDFRCIQMPFDHALRVWNLQYDKGFGLSKAVFSNSGSPSDIVVPPKLVQSFLSRRIRMWADRCRAIANMLKYRVKRRFNK